MVEEKVYNSEETGEVNPNDPAVREAREKAVEYADRVLAGEEPWTEAGGDGEAADSGFDDIPEPKDDDVGETDSPAPEVVENPPIDHTELQADVSPPTEPEG